MNPDTSAWIAVIISIVIVLNLGVLLASAYWKLPQAERYLVNSRIVTDAKRVWRGNDPIARLNRMGAVALVFTFRGLLHRRGLIDRDEADRVPVNLRIWTAGPIMSSCLILLGSLGFWLMEKGNPL
jgi:hypothetical protein